MRRRSSVLEWLWNMVQRSERRIIRVMALASVLLVVMQISAVRDPLQFYIAMASKIEAPPIDLPPLKNSTPVINHNKTWQISLKATPAAPIRVLQNGKAIASLAKGEQLIAVQAGQIQLDGRDISGPVQVQVTKKEAQLAEPRQNQVFLVRGNIQTINITP